MKIPKFLESAVRQFQHNDCSGFTTGFDYKETVRLFICLQRAIKAQSKLLACYRLGSQPPERVFTDIEAARKNGVEI